MTYKIVPKESGVFTASDVYEDVREEFASPYVYYAFLGNHVPYAEDSDDPVQIHDNELTKHDAYDKMLFGKRLQSTDVNLVVPRYDYYSQRVYAAYDDTGESLFTKNFFVTVKRGSEYDVFKCLDNNGGAVSTVEPDKTQITQADEIYRTADNYVWKYMYTIPSTVFSRFATVDFVPVVANTEVQDAATPGSIDVIRVDYGGTKYDNYLYGVVGSNDLNIGGSQYKINVSGNTNSSSYDDFYTGCIFKVISGTGAGEYAEIESYVTSGQNRVITINKILTLDLTSAWQITPAIRVNGNRDSSANAVVARAIINSVANSVDYVEILDRGGLYTRANAEVVYSTVVPVTSDAVVRPILGPAGGHGSDPASELGASRVCFSVTFNESVDGLPSINDFRQIGLMTNPHFARVDVDFSAKDSTGFISGETVYKIKPVRLFASDVTVNTSSNTVTANASYFESLEVGSFVYLVSVDGKQLAKIQSISDNTTLTLDATGSFSCTDTQIYTTPVYAESQVVADKVMGVTLTEVYAPYGTGDEVIGLSSGAYGVVNSISVSNEATTLDTFNQMWKYYVTTGDTFTPDELIVAPDTNASNAHGYFFGIVGTSPKIMYISDQVGTINTGETVTGTVSNKTAIITDAYQPDLIYNSGKIVYLENLEKVTRSQGQKETFKIIYEF